MASAVVKKSALGTLTKLGKGGQGTVYGVPGALLHLQSTAATFGQAVYKEYHTSILKDVNVSVLQSMVAFYPTLPFSAAEELLTRAAWPVCLVEESGNIVGFLMPCIPSRFTVNLRLPSGAHKKVNAEFQHLLNDESFIASHGFSITDRERFALLYELAKLLSFFHDHNIAVGDLSPKNVLFSLSPAPGVYLIDCDSISFRNNAVLPQVETPGWMIRDISRSERLGTALSDRYKFGLFVLRLFAGNQVVRDHKTLPAKVPSWVRSMLKQSLSASSRARPHMRQWLKPLVQAAAEPSPKPTHKWRFAVCTAALLILAMWVYDPGEQPAVAPPAQSSTAANTQPRPSGAPSIVRVETFQEGVLVFFRLHFTDTDGDAEGFGFRGAYGAAWSEENHPLSRPSYGRVKPGRVEYPFNLGCGTRSAQESVVEAWIYDRKGYYSKSVFVDLKCSSTQRK